MDTVRRGRGRPQKWLGDAHEVLSETGHPLTIADIRDSIERRGVDGSHELKNTTLYGSLNSSAGFVRVAGRPGEFGLTDWYAPAESLRRVRAYIEGRPDDLDRRGLTRDVEFVVTEPRCGEWDAELASIESALAGRARSLHALMEARDPAEYNALLQLLAALETVCPQLTRRLGQIRGGEVAEESEDERDDIDGRIAAAMADAEGKLNSLRQEIDDALADAHRRTRDEISETRGELKGLMRDLPAQMAQRATLWMLVVFLGGIAVGVLSNLVVALLASH